MEHLANYLLGQQFAAGWGLSTVLADFDFETYSEAGYAWNETEQKWVAPPHATGNKRGLRLVGMRAYIEHPSFEVLSLAYDLKDGRGKRHWWPGAPAPQDLLDYVAAGGWIEGWNVGFEFLVWNLYCVPKFGWPELREEQVRCAMAKARAFAMPGALASAGEVLDIPHKKDPDGERLLEKFSKPCNPIKSKPWRRRHYLWEEPEDAVKLATYNIRDIVAEEEASLRCPDLLPFELEVWQIDQRINRRGVHIDVVGLDNCISIVEQAYAKYNAELFRITGGAVSEASEVAKLQGWLAGRGCFLNDMEWETVDAKVKEFEALVSGGLLDKDDPVLRVLQLRRMLGAASVKKLYAIKTSLCNDRIYDLFMFFKARTGRWTGAGAQPQNLYKGKLIQSPKDQDKAFDAIATRSLDYVEALYGDPIELVACAIRGLFVARPGYRLISSDFSAIEGVVAACLAGEDWLIEVFRTHGKLYESFASRLAGVPFDEFIRHKKETGNHHPLRNGLGKLAALSGQFGAWIAGWKRFGAEEVLGCDDNIKDAILTYRDSVPNIVEMWGGQTRGFRSNRRQECFGLEGAIVQAIKNPGTAFTHRGIVYQMRDDILYCQVPSGGFITYHKPRLQPSRRFDWTPAWEVSISYEGWNENPQMGPIGWIRMDLYGGKAFENVVQRVARDFQCNAMVNAEKAGYAIVLHSHDELVTEVPLGFGSVEGLEACANALPWWARVSGGRFDGEWWPVKMKGGWEGPRYGKFD